MKELLLKLIEIESIVLNLKKENELLKQEIKYLKKIKKT